MNTINPAIPALACYGTHNKSSLFGDAVSICRGGWGNSRFWQHAGLFSHRNGQLICTEETAEGIADDPITAYEGQELIVGAYYWHGWDDPVKCQAAIAYLENTMAMHGAASRYNYFALLAEIPVIGGAFQWAWDSPEMICSQLVAYMHMKYGCPYFVTDHLAPDQLPGCFQRGMAYGDVTYYPNVYL